MIAVMTLKRVALIAIPLGLLLTVIGVFGYVNENNAHLLLWVGLVALAVGLGSVFVAAWRKSPARD